MAPVSVLVVDDMPDAAHTTADVLRLLGFDARAAVSPLDAIRAAAVDPPDVVVMDLGRPDVSGFDLARHMCGMSARRPLLVALTGLQGAAPRCQAAGFDLYVLKPADPTQFAALIRAAMGRRANSVARHGAAR
jgi:DNA-binding response OmpR family regulator